jgi:phage shock protein PspC (stress-responsive transcriptional regulator)
MQESRSNLFTSDDTLFGVCEALGQDFGFNPIYLRVTLAVLLLWNPAVVVGTYLAAGVVIAATRFLFPNPRAVPSATPMQRVQAAAASDEPRSEDHETADEELAVAA